MLKNYIISLLGCFFIFTITTSSAVYGEYKEATVEPAGVGMTKTVFHMRDDQIAVEIYNITTSVEQIHISYIPSGGFDIAQGDSGYVAPDYLYQVYLDTANRLTGLSRDDVNMLAALTIFNLSEALSSTALPMADTKMLNYNNWTLFSRSSYDYKNERFRSISINVYRLGSEALNHTKMNVFHQDSYKY